MQGLLIGIIRAYNASDDSLCFLLLRCYSFIDQLMMLQDA